jgi:putative NADH-flavin reductase
VAQGFAQIGDVGLQAGHGAARWVVNPDGVDQPIGRDDLTLCEQQYRRHRALLRRPAVHRLRSMQDPQWPEQPVVRACNVDGHCERATFRAARMFHVSRGATMRLAIFGGTGPTGRLLIEMACNSGHDVVAFARTPGNLPKPDRVSPVGGQLDDTVAISAEVEGADAVLSVLGPGTQKDDIAPLIAGYRNIVAAMDRHDVSRLVAIGTPSIRQPDDSPDRKVAVMVRAVKTLQPVAYRALVPIGDIIASSDLDWTIVRVPLLSTGPVTDTINVRGSVRRAASASRAPAPPDSCSTRQPTGPVSAGRPTSATSERYLALS